MGGGVGLAVVVVVSVARQVTDESLRQGHHFWTLLSSVRALQAGSLLAYRLNDPGAGNYYASQIEGVQLLLNNHLAAYGGWVATLQDPNPLTTDGGLPPGRSGLDCALPLAINHFGYVNESETDGGQYSPASPPALVSLHAYVKSFKGLYDINGGKNWTDGWAVGRYAEDIYNGTGTSEGNPWYVPSLHRLRPPLTRQVHLHVRCGRAAVSSQGPDRHARGDPYRHHDPLLLG